jgi:DNA repair protein RadC
VAVAPQQMFHSNCMHIGIIMKKIKGIPEFDRPRERMEKKGPAAQIIGIDVVDHIIVGRNGYFSFQAAGLLKQ